MLLSCFFFSEEFDIIPVTEGKNRSPVVHIEHNIAIEAWCVKIVFLYCYDNCLKLEPAWRKEFARWEQYLRTALLLNPNISTFWNYRKRLIACNLIEPEQDFSLTRIVVSRKPKSVEALAHRRWLLKRSTNHADVVQSELNLCTLLASKTKCNYHAWTHRQWVLTRTFAQQSGFDLALWLSEWHVSEEWTGAHVSDHSGWQYRQFLIGLLSGNLNRNNSDLEMLRKLVRGTAVQTTPQLFASLLNEELRQNEELIFTFAGHESLWCHRRFLVQSIGPFLPWMDDSFIVRCTQHCRADVNQKRSLEHHRRWLTLNS